MRRPALAAALCVSVLVAACAKAGTGSGGIAYETGSSRLVLRIESTGVSPEYVAASIPEFSLYGDGTAVTQGAVPEIYPGPAYPPLFAAKVDIDGMRRILAAAAGLLGPNRTYSSGGVVGAPTTVFTLVANGERHAISVYALGTAGVAGMSSQERKARAALLALSSHLMNLHGWLRGAVGRDRPFAFQRFRVYARPATGADLHQPAPKPNILDWPLVTPLSSFGRPTRIPPGYRCGVVQGADFRSFLPLAKRATQITLWRSAGGLNRLLLVPMLPDQTGCPASPSA